MHYMQRLIGVHSIGVHAGDGNGSVGHGSNGSNGSPFLLAHSKKELMQWRGVRSLSVCPSVKCKLLYVSSVSLLLSGKWPDRDRTCTRWSPGKPASRVCSRSRWQGQRQRSRDTRTFLDSWNELLHHWRSG